MKKVGVLIFLFALLSACEAPAITEPTVKIQITPSRTITPLPTFTFQPQSSSKTSYCQAEPEYIQLGSTTKIAVFSLPGNQLFAVSLDSKFIATGTTNMDGYARIDVFISTDETVGSHQIAIHPVETNSIVTCRIWLWSNSIPSPAIQPAPTSTSRPTFSPDELTMTATQQTLLERLGEYCLYGSASGAKLSPDGLWVEVNCEPDVIKIISIDESTVWDVSSSELIQPYSTHFVHVAHWSNDGTYVYVFINPHTDGYWEPFHQGIVLYRLTLQTGQFSEVLPLGKSDWVYYAFSFSPNDSRLAYIVTDKSPTTLIVRDMQTGIEKSFQFDSKYNSGGSFLWSPNSQDLIFSITNYDTINNEYPATSVVLWNREESNVVTLVKEYKEVLVPVKWLDGTKVLLQALNENDRKFEFDITNKELNQISP